MKFSDLLIDEEKKKRLDAEAGGGAGGGGAGAGAGAGAGGSSAGGNSGSTGSSGDGGSADGGSSGDSSAPSSDSTPSTDSPAVQRGFFIGGWSPAKKRKKKKKQFKFGGGIYEAIKTVEKCPRTKSSGCQCEKLNNLSEAEETVKAIAQLEHTEGDVQGAVKFKQKPGQPTIIQGIIKGLKPGKHGFHIHEFGDLSDGCASAGGHYNPEGVDHGSLEKGHVGDLGNIVADKSGTSRFQIKAERVDLSDVVGRAIVVHADEDDLGKGGDEESLKTGNAGDRLGCGVIRLQEVVEENYKRKVSDKHFDRNQLPQIRRPDIQDSPFKYKEGKISIKLIKPVQTQRVAGLAKKSQNVFLQDIDRPFIVDKKGYLINGHHRYDAAHMLGMRTVPAIMIDANIEDVMKHFSHKTSDTKVMAENHWKNLREKWSKKYKDSINCSNPKGFSQKAHCAGKKKKTETKEAPKGTYFTKTGNLVKGRLTKAAKERGARETDPKDKSRSKVPPVTQTRESDYDLGGPRIDKDNTWRKFLRYKYKFKSAGSSIADMERIIRKKSPKEFNDLMNLKDRFYAGDQDLKTEGKRIPRKKGQPAGSKKHSDLYTDENPKGTIHGLKFATVKDAKASVSKIRNSGKKHAHKIQAAVAMEQRAKAAGKKSAAAVYRKFINQMKKKTKKMNEGDVSNSLDRRRAQKGKDKYQKVVDVPVSRTGEKFDKFVVVPSESGKVGHMVGMKDGKAQDLGTTTIDMANALVDAFNRGGFSDLPIQKIDMDEDIVGMNPQAKKPYFSPEEADRANDEWINQAQVDQEDGVIIKGTDGKQYRIMTSYNNEHFEDGEVYLQGLTDPNYIDTEGYPDAAELLYYHSATGHYVEENFADGKKKGKSRPGRVKRSGASCKGSVTSLRAKAKKYSGERGKMYHWCANMKGGKKKKK